MTEEIKYFNIPKDKLEDSEIYPFDIYYAENKISPTLFLGLGNAIEKQHLSYINTIAPNTILMVKYEDQDAVCKFFDLKKEQYFEEYNQSHPLMELYHDQISKNYEANNFIIMEQIVKAVRSDKFSLILKQCQRELFLIPYDVTQWISTIKGISEEILKREDEVSQKACLSYFLGKEIFNMPNDELINLMAISYFEEFKKVFELEQYKKIITLFIDELNLEYDPRFLMHINQIPFSNSEDYEVVLEVANFLTSIKKQTVTDDFIKKCVLSSRAKKISVDILENN